ncbi:MAG: CarD family transcriptional regulator [Clostridiales bacterium]|jgi:CarD family transcriptional regulator|nr:CarD family transcriptional regulator [Clostridiales bacterium]
MFAKGDKIVYPMYGAGVIEDLEEREIDGDSQMFYVLRIPVGNLKIMIAASNAEHLGIRHIYEKDEMLRIIESVSLKPIEMPDNWNLRYKSNMEKIKSGQLTEVVLVFRNLLLREKQRGLSSAEKKMMTTAKQIIVSELILSQDMEKNNAEDMLTQMFNEVSS